MRDERTYTRPVIKKNIKHCQLPALISVLIFFLLMPSLSVAQLPAGPQQVSDPPLQTIYLEAFGNAVLFSLNYDLVFDNRYGLRLGFGAMPQSGDELSGRQQPLLSFADSPYYFAVIMGNYFIGSGNDRLELGGGFLLGEVTEEDEWDRPGPTAATFTLGYRYMPPEGRGVLLRFGATPIFEFSGNFHLRFGASIGWIL